MFISTLQQLDRHKVLTASTILLNVRELSDGKTYVYVFILYVYGMLLQSLNLRTLNFGRCALWNHCVARGGEATTHLISLHLIF